VAEELGAQVENITAVSSLADAVISSDIICVCLSDDAAVDAVFSSIIDNASVAGRLFVDLSTIHPDTASAHAERLQSLGAEYLGSPSKHNDTLFCFTWVYRDSPNSF
jgi:3-hydroxyisobutyrate dehydrogenase-like beta-hydroxyacid dehydrogenase